MFKIFKKNSVKVYAPCDGEIFKITKISDPVFAQEFVGKGVFIRPDSNEFYSPIEGTVETVMDTKHAIGLKHESGLEFLIHMGLDTVELKSEGFKVYVKKGDSLNSDTHVATFDRKKVENLKKSIDTPIIVTNDSLKNKKVVIINEGKVQRGQPIFEVI